MMEQRRYKTKISPEALGNYLAQHYNQERRTEAQCLGEGDSVLVQVREGHEDHQRIALTIGIAGGNPAQSGAAPGISHAADEEPAAAAPEAKPASQNDELIVTLGQQQWFQGQHLGGVVGMLIGALFTPWALFGLIWPATRMVSDYFKPQEVWGLIENYLLTQGATLISSDNLQHPHQDAF